MHNLPRTSALFLLITATACMSVDQERDLMKGAIEQSQRLSSEIVNWRTMAPSNTQATEESIGAFQDRADEIVGTLNGVSTQARKGTDVSGLVQALETLRDFDTDRYDSASQTARDSLLDQFAGLARNVQQSASRIRA
ncbi:MAG: hypothetical protein KDE27_28525 [Planctomycetes bacterium]|nr:hypothetical protein [Planctomycetota bacterium]